MTKRDAIIWLYREGKPISKIIKQLKVSKSTVYDAAKRYIELDNTKDSPKTGRPRSYRTNRNIKSIRERISKKGSQTLREKTAWDF